MGKTISLYFEDSPTTISFPNSSDEEVPCSKEKEVVEITSNEFCNGIVLLGMNLMQQTAVIITNGLNSFIRNIIFVLHDNSNLEQNNEKTCETYSILLYLQIKLTHIAADYGID